MVRARKAKGGARNQQKSVRERRKGRWWCGAGEQAGRSRSRMRGREAGWEGDARAMDGVRAMDDGW